MWVEARAVGTTKKLLQAYGGHQHSPQRIQWGLAPTGRAHPDEEGLLLCRPLGELQIPGFSSEGPRGCQSILHAEGDPGK